MTAYKTYTQALPGGPTFQMIRIPGGTFQMGGADDQAYDDEKPVHPVTVPDFYLGRYPVTQALWVAVMGGNPAYFKGKTHPVENVSWDDCQDFIQQLNARTGIAYRLPTEAEWEYAARGGSYSEGYRYAGSDNLNEVGWYQENSYGETHPVGQKLPNELGLYDLSGNIDEWCEDVWHHSYEGAPSDGSARIGEPLNSYFPRGLRGGFFYSDAQRCRVSSRSDNRLANQASRIQGLRLACSAIHLDAILP
ncbi:MAG: formylglycine-generating enzyme family protein [Bacteroidia bacterium]|nr:formylglycine-generating enzyme family protein [Bacteroidia bacterium]